MSIQRAWEFPHLVMAPWMALAAGAVLAGDESEEGHELNGGPSNRRRSPSSAMTVMAATVLEAFEGHHVRRRRVSTPSRPEQLHHFLHEPVKAEPAVLDGEQVFLEHDLLDGASAARGRGDSSCAGRSRWRCRTVAVAVAEQEGLEPLFGAGKVVRRVGACTGDVADGLVV